MMHVAEKEAVTVPVADVFGRNPSGKQKAVDYQNRELLPAVRRGDSVVFDFTGVDFVGQSFAGAMTSVLRAHLGDEFPSVVRFENCSSMVRSVISFATQVPVRR